MERCPQQWQLLHAQYGDRLGFPSRPSAPAVEGQLIHEGLESLFRACALAGMPTVGSPAFIEVMGALGLVGLLRAMMGEREKRIAGHPRGAGFRFRHSAAQLANEVIRLFRQQYQPQNTGPLVLQPAPPGSLPPASLLQTLRALKALPEVKVTHPTLPFMGVIDLVRDGPAGVVISDFKTGQPSSTHEHQLLAYAVLWWRVTGEAPATVEIVYPASTVSKAITVAALEQAETLLKQRVASTAAMLAAQPGQAKTGDHCRHCDVRQFCSDYWATTTAPKSGDWLDVAATVVGTKGVAGVDITWAGGSAHLVFQPGTPAARRLPDAGGILRILGAKRVAPDVFELAPATEVFLVGP